MRLTLLLLVVAISGCKEDDTTGFDSVIPFQFSEEHLQVAEHFAPVIYQETGDKPKYDALTNFDFDDDYEGDNNWKNAEKKDLPAYVYYSVIESTSHYYIFYGFFHPRDYERKCAPIFCHENDFEGAMLMVRKSETMLYGYVEYVETQAHDHFYSYKPELVEHPNTVGDHQRVGLFIEKRGHGVYQINGHDSILEQECGSNGKDFDKGKHRSLEDTDKNHLVYTYQDYAEQTNGAKSGEFSYALIPMTDFWNKLGDRNYDALFNFPFTYKGARYARGKFPMSFYGKKYSVSEFGTAKPPWGWEDNRCKSIKRGDWYFDPAFAIKKRLGLPLSINDAYTYNPFLDQ